MSYLNRITIYVPPMKLKIIDDYCKVNAISKSKLFVRGVMSIVNQAPKERCNFCAKEGMGKYAISYYDADSGDTEKEVPLCQFHLDESKRRYEVKEL